MDFSGNGSTFIEIGFFYNRDEKRVMHCSISFKDMIIFEPCQIRSIYIYIYNMMLLITVKICQINNDYIYIYIYINNDYSLEDYLEALAKAPRCNQ